MILGKTVKIPDASRLLLLKYIYWDMPDLVNNRVMVEALQYYGKMSRNSIKTVLSALSGPNLNIYDINEATPHYHDLNNINMSDYYLNMFVTGDDVVISSYGKRVHGLGVEILVAIVLVYNGHNFQLRDGFLKNLYGIDNAHPWRQRGTLGIYRTANFQPG